MALKIDAEFKGIMVQSAYITIVTPSVSLNKRYINFDVWYRSAAGEEPFVTSLETAPYNLDGENIYVQAYTYLKGLPVFQGAVDC